MTYITDQNSAELRAHIRSLQKHPEWRDAVTDRLFKEIVSQDAQIELLKAALKAAKEWLPQDPGPDMPMAKADLLVINEALGG